MFAVWNPAKVEAEQIWLLRGRLGNPSKFDCTRFRSQLGMGEEDKAAGGEHRGAELNLSVKTLVHEIYNC